MKSVLILSMWILFFCLKKEKTYFQHKFVGVFKIFNFKKILSVLVCALFFRSALQTAGAMEQSRNQSTDNAAFSYNMLLKSNRTLIVTTYTPPEIQTAENRLKKEYFTLIESQYILGEKYSESLINWRKDVFDNYQFILKSFGKLTAVSFLLTIHNECHKEHIVDTSLYNLEKSEVYLITPTSQENAMLSHIASDPNGSIQIKLLYEPSKPGRIETILYICI